VSASYVDDGGLPELPTAILVHHGIEGSRLAIYRPNKKILVVVDRKKEKVSSIS
jgi:hypothetical protein